MNENEEKLLIAIMQMIKGYMSENDTLNIGQLCSDIHQRTRLHAISIAGSVAGAGRILKEKPTTIHQGITDKGYRDAAKAIVSSFLKKSA